MKLLKVDFCENPEFRSYLTPLKPYCYLYKNFFVQLTKNTKLKTKTKYLSAVAPLRIHQYKISMAQISFFSAFNRLKLKMWIRSFSIHIWLIFLKCGDLTVQKVEIDFQLTKKVFMSLPAFILNIEEEKSPF